MDFPTAKENYGSSQILHVQLKRDVCVQVVIHALCYTDLSAGSILAV